MLSIVDIKRELGKNLYIYPLTTSAIKSNSIDLHASKFAWSISTKKSLFNGVDKIIIPPHDTALVYSKEAIYVSNKIGGSYHSKVRLVSQGFGHIGTSLDAQYIGLSIVAIHNITDSPKEIGVGNEFVTVVFHYLHTDDYIDTVSHDNPPGHPSLIADFENVADFLDWEENNRWCRNKSDLYIAMINSSEYKECKKQFNTEQLVFNRKYIRKKIFKYTLIVIFWLLVNILLSIPAYFVEITPITDICTTLIEKLSLPIITSIIIPNIISDFRKD